MKTAIKKCLEIINRAWKWSDYGWNIFNPDGTIQHGVQLPKPKKLTMTSEEYYSRKR